tara:strand:+ start:770 stop:907 length:138 start_codon:yes stop_codon:yes gene_type:complete
MGKEKTAGITPNRLEQEEKNIYLIMRLVVILNQISLKFNSLQISN